MMKKNKTQKGLTLVELMVATVVALVIFGGIAAVIAENHRSWNNIFRKTHQGIITDSIIARKTFDTLVRKASSSNFTIDTDGAWIEVQYYNDGASTVFDRYALIYVADEKLMVEYGDPITAAALYSSTVCSNVSSCKFLLTGGSVQMILNLDDGTDTLTVISSALMHN